MSRNVPNTGVTGGKIIDIPYRVRVLRPFRCELPSSSNRDWQNASLSWHIGQGNRNRRHEYIDYLITFLAVSHTHKNTFLLLL